MNKKIRLVGDQHQNHKRYLKLIDNCDYSIQLGDLGLNYGGLKYVGSNDYLFDTNKHKFLSGNHDCYDVCSQDYCLNQPNCLGNYGVYNIPGFEPIFFVRGAWSIDWKPRKREGDMTGMVSWWPEEELSVAELEKAIDLYKEVKPDFVISHEAPTSIIHNFTDPKFPTYFGYKPGVQKTRTGAALDVMFEYHQPKRHFFGHFHRRWTEIINGTEFHCIDMDRSPNQTTDYYDMEF